MATSNKQKRVASPPNDQPQDQQKKRARTTDTTTLRQRSEDKEEEQEEEWLVERLKDPSIYLPLQLQYNEYSHDVALLPSKEHIYKQLAEEFNQKNLPRPLATGACCYADSINSHGIKHKISRIQLAFRSAHTLRQTLEDNSGDDQSWISAVLEKCRFYFDLFDTWGPYWCENSLPSKDSAADVLDSYGMEGPFPKDIVKDAKESRGEHERKDFADVSPQEDQDEILVNKQRLGTEFASKKHATPPPSISPISASSPPRFTPYTADDRQETPVTQEADGSEPKHCILEDNIFADLGEHSEDLALVIRSTTDLEYHKALIAERLIMKVLEMKMREKEMDHLLEMAKIQANKEVLLARYQSEMMSRRNATSSYNHDTPTRPSEE